MAKAERQGLRAVLLIAGVSACAAALISGSYEISAERIRQNQRAELLRTLHEVLDPTLHDNDLTSDQIWVTDPDLLGTQEPVQAYLATRDGQPVAAILAPVAPNGYIGPINLLVGIRMDGTITGVRVTAHRETPGLGDQVEIERSDWIRGFEGKSLSDPPLAEWRVVSDGGQFDTFTSATVTPRAIVQAVSNALLYFREHGAELFSEIPNPGGDP